MKKLIKSFGDFTRRKINEDHFFYDEESYSDSEDLNIGDPVYITGMEDLPGRIVDFIEDKHGNPLVVVRIAGEEDVYRKHDVYKIYENAGGGYQKMATASVSDNYRNGSYLYIEYEDKSEFIDWELGSENNVSSWIKVFEIVDSLGAAPNMIRFKYLRERTDGKGYMRATKMVGRDILDSEEYFDFNNYRI